MAMRVRWSTKCAGGCGHMLLPGNHATAAHHGLWCAECWATHRSRCGAHEPTAKPLVEPLHEATLFDDLEEA